MDVSLDDYISTSNFKIQIGNPGFKGNNKPGGNVSGGFPQGKSGGFQQVKGGGFQQGKGGGFQQGKGGGFQQGKGGGFQQGKKKFGNVKFGNKAQNVSVTVPAVPKTSVKVNMTNQVRDARERLVSKQTIQDARQKISQKVPADARQKLQTLRANKGANTGVVDARVKIQAKKHFNPPANNQQNVQDFTLTRTVNNNASNVQLTGGDLGNIHITKTLTKVMPPGYEALVGNSPTATSSVTHGPSTSVALQRGPPIGRQGDISNIVRTVPNTSAQINPPPVHRVQTHPGQSLPPYPTQGPQFHPSQPQPSHTHTHTVFHIENHPRPPRLHAPVPQPLQPPPQVQVFVAPPNMPPAPHVIHPPKQAPPPADPRVEGPPYPVEDLVLPAARTLPPQHMAGPLPRIQVQNDQYRPPVPSYPQYSAPPPAPAPSVHQPPYPYYPPSAPQQPYLPQEPVIQRTTHQSELPIQPSTHQMEHPIRRTTHQFESPEPRTAPRMEPPIQRTAHQDLRTVPSRDYAEESYSSSRSSGVKRKTSDSSGPLKLSSTNTIPVLVDVGSRSAPSERSKERSYTRAAEPPLKKLKDEDDFISPLQGYKVLISNLHLSVTQDDVIELFGAIGAVKKVRIMKPGTAEVVYVSRKNAIAAIDIYHERNLDGQPMTVKLATPETARVKEPAESLPPSVKPAATGPLKLSKKPAGMAKVSSDKKGLEVDILHKALFKSASTSSSKPVTFTVNI